MTFQSSYLPSYQRSFERRIFPLVQTLLASYERSFPEEVLHTRELVLRGGKRLRSAIYAHLLASKNMPENQTMEALIELFHVTLLIHDDIVDEADERRGGPSFHRAIGDSHRAVIWGDVVISELMKLFLEKGDLRVVKVFSDVLASTCEGQMMDIHLRARNAGAREIDESYIFKCYELKTGIYGFYFPVALALGESGVEFDPAVLWKLARVAGILYQVQDDMLIFDPRGEHKSVEADFKMRQLTYPLWWTQAESGVDLYSELPAEFNAWRTAAARLFNDHGGAERVPTRLRALYEEARVLKVDADVMNLLDDIFCALIRPTAGA